MEMGRRGLLPEGKHLFRKKWIYIWELPGKYKKLWLIEVTEAKITTKGVWSNQHRGESELHYQYLWKDTNVYRCSNFIAMVQGLNLYT